MSDQTTPQRPGTSRRDFLRRGAIVGGTLVWAAPTVQRFGPSALASYVVPATLYLKNTSLPGDMSADIPAGPARVKEIDKDSKAVTDQTDDDKFHTWQTAQAPAEGLVINGTVTLYLYIRAHANDKDLKVQAQLYDCDANAPADSTNCTTIGGTAELVIQKPAGSFAERVLNFGARNHTITTGRRLRVKIANIDLDPNKSDDDMDIQWNQSSESASRLEVT